MQTLLGDEAHAGALSSLIPGFPNQVLDMPHADELSSRQLELMFACGTSQDHRPGAHDFSATPVM